MAYSLIAYREERIREKANEIAKDLRKMADDLERLSKNEKVENIPAYVTHSVLWGVSNLGIDHLSSLTVDLIEAHKAEIEIALEQWEVDGDDEHLVNEVIEPFVKRGKK